MKCAVAGAWLRGVVEDCAPTLEDVSKESAMKWRHLLREVTDDKALKKQSAKPFKSRPL